MNSDHKEEYFGSQSSSSSSSSPYYKRSNLLPSSSATTFREKYNKRFGRKRSSSYTSLDDKQQQKYNSSWDQPSIKATSLISSVVSPFSREKKIPKRSSFLHSDQLVRDSYFDDEEEEEEEERYSDYIEDENAYLTQHINREDSTKGSISWRSSVWRVIRVKSR
ncbi:uncharacterized protein BX663DRAFT_546876 [Cokeromyces recurvatus]|uniref:uncharacterized protein n=1 Tax=Cokeromyces recurvatus TaxID=90255 RepID=UPI00221F6D82|nr:uncharacterized protein BX663DRAFT_546876 [Cokeromyces recurvatus]KAI7897823.1 hypothetical protein BX663DRAFT_546876 [Cokeromyces recurvatus]